MSSLRPSRRCRRARTLVSSAMSAVSSSEVGGQARLERVQARGIAANRRYDVPVAGCKIALPARDQGPRDAPMMSTAGLLAIVILQNQGFQGCRRGGSGVAATASPGIRQGQKWHRGLLQCHNNRRCFECRYRKVIIVIGGFAGRLGKRWQIRHDTRASKEKEGSAWGQQRRSCVASSHQSLRPLSEWER